MLRTSIGTSLATIVAFGGLEGSKTAVSALNLNQIDADNEFLAPVAQTPQILAQVQAGQAGAYKSVRGDDWVSIVFTNDSMQRVELFWHDYQGNRRSYGQIGQGQSLGMWTYSSHPWSVTGVSDSNADLSVDGFEVFIPVDSDSHRTIRIAETYQSVSSDGLISITFENRTSESVLLKWHSFDGDLLDYSTVAAGATYTQGTYATHPWSAHGTGDLTVDGHEVYIPVQGDDGRTVYVTQAGSEVATDSTTLPTVTGTTGTIFLNGNWVPDTAATVYNGVTSTGACRRNMFDRRDDAFAMRDAWCFDTQFGDETKTVEIQVNSLDFDQNEAQSKAQFFGRHIGKLPKLLRRDVQTVWIHDGMNGFGGGNNNLLIHTQQADAYIRDGILDETFIHEAAHTSLDGHLYGTAQYNDAVAADGRYISDYARDNPQREDIAETYLVWFATRYAKDTFTYKEIAQWNHHMENRFEVFDKICEDMSPYDNYCVF